MAVVNLRTFDLNLLRIFEAIHRDGSVSKAADTLGLSQPAVSNALNRLRRQFDDPLFVRTQRGMEPTPKAEQLALAVDNGMTTIRAGLSAGVDFDPARSERRFTLLMTDVGEISFLPILLSELRRNAPGIDISVVESGLGGYEELLDNGMADLAIGRIRLAETLSSELIHSSPFVVLLSRTHPRLGTAPDGRPTLSYADYLAAPHVLVQPRGASGDPIREALGEDAAKRRIGLSLPHTTVLPMIIGDTELIATVPEVCAQNLIASGKLCRVDVPFAIEHNFVYQWWHKRNTADPGHRWLRGIFANAGI